jgi:TPR repeat protein
MHNTDSSSNNSTSSTTPPSNPVQQQTTTTASNQAKKAAYKQAKLHAQKAYYHKLGKTYEEEQKWEEALQNYKKAAELGHPDAQYILSKFYSFVYAGHITDDRDIPKAWRLAHKAAEQGHSGA